MILFDAHVHIYDCFDLNSFFTSAYNNFSEAEKKINAAAGGSSNYFLLLTEAGDCNYFTRLQELSVVGNWSVETLEENVSLAVSHNENPEMKLIVVAGRQIVTREKLELLALMTGADFPDILELPEAVEAVVAGGGVPVCPWGAGKWLGARGKLLEGYCKAGHASPFFLGDSGGRPSVWPRSTLCNNIKFADHLISGSDPLPLKSEEARAGSFGGFINAECDVSQPVAGLKPLFLNDRTSIAPFGSSMHPISFVKSQLRLRL